MARLKHENEKKAWKTYIADILNAVARANYENWKVPFYSDIVLKKERKAQVEKRTGDEIALDVIQRAGLKFKGKEE